MLRQHLVYSSVICEVVLRIDILVEIDGSPKNYCNNINKESYNLKKDKKINFVRNVLPTACYIYSDTQLA